MAIEYRAICKDCNQEFGYSNESLESGSTRGLSRPERCPKCRRTHSREGRSIGIPQIKVKPTGPRRPDIELSPGRLGKISHPERPHKKVIVESKFGRPDSNIEFGITDDDIRRLIETMRDYQVTVVVGPTGSGKSTFLPYRLMVPPEGIEPDIFTRYGQIVVTQPRIQATRNIARFVAQDLHGSSLGAGFDVGFRHSNAPASDWRNKLVYITDGTLINWVVSGQISNLSIIMIDEAHERSLNIDLILGLLKQQLPRFPDLKLIIASATINAELFQGYFGGPDKAALIQFRGLKQHRMDAFFPFLDYMLRNDRNVPGHMAEKIRKILIDIREGEKSEGDILGFLQGEGAIDDCIERLRQKVMETPELRNGDINIYPLYSGLSQAEQDLALKKKAESIRDKVFKYIHDYTPTMPDRVIALLLDYKSASETWKLVQKGIEEAKIKDWTAVLLGQDKNDFNEFPYQILFTTHEAFSEMKNTGEFYIITDRRVIISTNLAETSLTVDGIVYVVDSGLIKEAHWYAKNSARDLVPVFHSRAGCRQRWGRAGRVRDGEVHMLYTDSQFEDEGVFPAHTLPEIQRSSLEEVILKSKAAGVDDIEKFNWIQKPPLDELERAPAMLKKMGALDAEGDLTGYGAELQSFASDVPVASLLVSADQYACGVEMATFAAMSQARVKGGFLAWDKRWDFATRHYVERVHRQFSEACRDDLEFFLKVYSLWAETMDSEIRSKVCKLFFINEEEISSKVALARNKFMEMLSVAKKVEEDRAISFVSLDRLRILLAVTLPEEFIYKTDNKGSISVYGENNGSIPFKIDEGSVLAEKPPSVFLAMSRRIIKKKKGDEELLLSGLVRLRPEWIKYREYSTIRLAAAMAEILKPKREIANIGRERYRLFLDILYPVGARYCLLENNTEGPVPGEKISDPEPVQPVFAEGAIKSADFLMPDAEKDADPLAGWEDKQDRQIPYDPQEGILETGDISGLDEEFITEGEHGSKENISDNNGIAHIPEMITTYGNGLIPIAEIRAAREIAPIFRWRSRTGGGEACEIAGHDFSNIAKPEVILKDSSVEQQESMPDYNLEPGRKVRVKA